MTSLKIIISTTSIAFILLSIGLAFCGYLFLRAFRKGDGSQSKIGLLVSMLFLGFAFQTGVILGGGTAFFAGNPTGLFFVLIAANSFLTLIAMFSIYVAYYIFAPRTSPVPVIVLTAMIGIASVILQIITHPQPHITPQGGVDWGMSFLLSLLTFYLLFISIGSQAYIFIKLFFQAATRQIKLLSFLFGTIATIGILVQFVQFVVLYRVSTDIRIRVYDVGTGLLGVGLIIAIVLLSLLFRKRSVVDKEKTS